MDAHQRQTSACPTAASARSSRVWAPLPSGVVVYLCHGPLPLADNMTTAAGRHTNATAHPQPAGIRRDALIHALRQRRDNPVVVPVAQVRYPGEEMIVRDLQAQLGHDTLEIVAEDGPDVLARRLDRCRPR